MATNVRHQPSSCKTKCVCVGKGPSVGKGSSVVGFPQRRVHADSRQSHTSRQPNRMVQERDTRPGQRVSDASGQLYALPPPTPVCGPAANAAPELRITPYSNPST